MAVAISELLSRSIARLRDAGIESAVLDAEVILAHLLDRERYRLRTEGQSIIQDEAARYVFNAIERRAQREPVAYITGSKEFYGFDFLVNSSVLIPRPETELLVDMVIYHTPYQGTLLDIGTGSGAVALSVKKNRKDVAVTATDISSSALALARENAARLLPPESSIEFLEGDLFDPLPGRKFNVIASNPPYIGLDEKNTLAPELGFEPSTALFAGVSGMDVIRKILAEAADYLADEGVLLIEIGSGQKEEVKRAGVDAGFSVSVMADYGGFDRLAVLKRS